MAVLMGFLNNESLKDRRVSTLNTQEVNDAIAATIAAHNQLMDEMLGLFVKRTTAAQLLFRTPTNATLQPMDENGKPLPVKGITTYTVGFPLQTAGHSWGATYNARQRMTVDELGQELVTAQLADINWMRNHIMAAFFFENGTTPWTWTDPLLGALSIYGLANGDTTTYQFKNGQAFATDDHVKGSSTSTLTTAVISDMASELKEHPTNTGDVIVFVPTASRATVEALTEFIPVSDTNLQYGTVTTTLRTRLPQNIPGEIFGYVEGTGAFVSEWPTMPSGYALGVTTGGEPPLAMREDAVDTLRGYQMVSEEESHPWWQRYFQRLAGFGAWNRVGGIVYKTSATTYSVPTGYDSPMG